MSPRARRHRRVDAPPTNLEADQSDDLVDTPAADCLDPAAGPAHGPATGRAGEPPAPRRTPAGVDARDRWILEQRPPHWD